MFREGGQLNGGRKGGGGGKGRHHLSGVQTSCA